MKNSIQNNSTTKQHKITLQTHSTANPAATVNALHAEWLSLQTSEYMLDLIASNIWTVANQRGLNPHNLYGMELDEYVHEVWIHVTERFIKPENRDSFAAAIQRRANKGTPEITLTTPICMSVWAVFENKRKKY